jgi:hypothetical protein
VFHPGDGERREALRRQYPGGTERIVEQQDPDRNFGLYESR